MQPTAALAMKTEDRARFAQIGDEGDTAITGSTVSIAGLGGMGTAVAGILARENVDLRLVDKGRVEEEDMHRLSVFYEEDITKFKVKVAKARLAAINPTVQVKSFHEELNEQNLFLMKGDVLIDTSNNEEINDLLFRHAIEKKLPLVLGRYAGSTYRVLVAQKKLPVKTLEKVALPGLDEKGVFGPVTTLTGSVLAGEVLKILLGENGSYIISGDAWKRTCRVTKL